jgi:hypothetical protein
MLAGKRGARVENALQPQFTVFDRPGRLMALPQKRGADTMKSDRSNPVSHSSLTSRQIGRRELLGGAAGATAAAAAGFLLLHPASALANTGGPTQQAITRLPFDPALASLLGNIRFGDNATRQAAVKQASLVGTMTIEPLGQVYGADDPGASKAALEAIQRVVNNAARPGAAAERQAAADSLLRLTSASQPRIVRSDALRLLGYVGGAAEVTAIADLLHVPDLREDARFALERIPDSSAEAALRKAARTVPADYRAAIDQSLRSRKTKPQEIGLRR